MRSDDFGELTLEDLRKLQQSLQRRAVIRDRGNHVAIGFGPKVAGGLRYAGLSARFVVRRKTGRVSQARRIPEKETVRLLQLGSRCYRKLTIATDVLESPQVGPVGVAVDHAGFNATSALVIRWSQTRPVPPAPTSDNWQDTRWRWGLVTVAHAISGSSSRRSTIERLAKCNQGPASIEGHVLVKGRLPGGPDCAVLETGAERLWLSGFLARPNMEYLSEVREQDILRWIRDGAHGYIHSIRKTGEWEMDSYYPQRTIETLGHLQHVVQFSQRGTLLGPAPFAPGTSGAVLVEGGVPMAMQVAATMPDYQTGFAQCFAATIPWLRQALQATSLGIIGVF